MWTFWGGHYSANTKLEQSKWKEREGKSMVRGSGWAEGRSCSALKTDVKSEIGSLREDFEQ